MTTREVRLDPYTVVMVQVPETTGEITPAPKVKAKSGNLLSRTKPNPKGKK